MRSYNDDLVIAVAIACWVRATALTANKKEGEYKKALLSGMSVSKTVFNSQIQGQHGFKSKPQRPTFRDQNGNLQDLSWITKG